MAGKRGHARKFAKPASTAFFGAPPKLKQARKIPLIVAVTHGEVLGGAPQAPLVTANFASGLAPQNQSSSRMAAIMARKSLF
jgi:hypothetical protein